MDATEQFKRLVGADVPDDDLALDEAMALIATRADPAVHIATVLRALDDLAATVDDRSLDGVVAHLYDGLGFAGDDETFHAAANSSLAAVLERRRGMPITLAVVVIEVARRLGLVAYGIGMPGHFLVGDGQGRLLDPFTGRWIDPGRARERFESVQPGAPWDATYLAPVSKRAILGRVLANLRTTHMARGDLGALLWVLEWRLAVPGQATDEDRAAHRRVLARLN